LERDIKLVGQQFVDFLLKFSSFVVEQITQTQAKLEGTILGVNLRDLAK